jgi:hypothetical protein
MVSEKIVTPEQIALYREQLADNQQALVALDVIEKWDGDLADAAESIAKLNGIEGVETNADLRWFAQQIKKCHKFICQSKYKNLRDKYVSTLIPILTEFLAGSLGCPPGVAGLIATPFALTISEEGMDKFCQSFNAQP